MTTRGLSYRQVRRRQTGALGAVVAATALMVVAVPVAAPVAGGVLSGAVVVAYFGTMVAAVVVVARARTVAARYVVETGRVPDVPVTQGFMRELTGLRASYTWWLLAAVSVLVVLPLGALSAALTGSGSPGPMLVTSGTLLAGVVAAAFSTRWLWRRRANVADVLEELETRG